MENLWVDSHINFFFFWSIPHIKDILFPDILHQIDPFHWRYSSIRIECLVTPIATSQVFFRFHHWIDRSIVPDLVWSACLSKKPLQMFANKLPMLRLTIIYYLISTVDWRNGSLCPVLLCPKWPLRQPVHSESSQ